MAFYRVGSDVELPSYFFVALTIGYQCNYFAFAFRHPYGISHFSFPLLESEFSNTRKEGTG
jgi:hypothetical protein